MTGITRMSKESIFSDLNHLKVVTTTSDVYAAAFGFTEEEVFTSLEECGLGEEKVKVKYWYDGFIFGNHTDIYNPWSVLNFLETGRYAPYWVNTSGNRLVSKLLQEGNKTIKTMFEDLLHGKTIRCPIDEQIVYHQLEKSESGVWSLFLASGYLKVICYEKGDEMQETAYLEYELAITNYEVRQMFLRMVNDWFGETQGNYNDFVKAMLKGNIKEMNVYMNRVARDVFSYFASGKRPSDKTICRFINSKRNSRR